MGSTLSFEQRDAIPRLQVIVHIVSDKIILSSTNDIANTAQQIALESNLPISSTYMHY